MRTKLSLSFGSILRVILRPPYAAMAGVIGFVFFQAVYWVFNLNILVLVVGSGIGFGDKIVFLLSPFQDIFTTTGMFVGTLMVLVAAIQGINLAVLVYTIKHQKRLSAGAVGGGSLAGLLAAVGLGCSACGTSLLVPVVAIFASTSAVAVSEKLVVIAPLLAVLVGLIGMYYLGIQAANVNAKHNLGRQTKDR